MAERIRVLIADDHPPTRKDVREALEADARFEVCAEANNAPAALTAAVESRPDICLLDVRMPGSGIAAAWEIKARLPETKVVMLTVSTDDVDLFAALRAGASGYLLKDVDPSRLTEALHDVMQGEPAIPPSLVGRIIDEFRDRGPRRRRVIADGPEGQLTSREWEVLDLMRAGNSTADMAKALFLSQATVRSHVASILRKLRVPDRESAIKLFEER
jgi:DNA-binding NarL/FixJ family response regulator